MSDQLPLALDRRRPMHSTFTQTVPRAWLSECIRQQFFMDTQEMLDVARRNCLMLSIRIAAPLGKPAEALKMRADLDPMSRPLESA